MTEAAGSLSSTLTTIDHFLQPRALPGTAADLVYHSTNSRTTYPGEPQAKFSSSHSQPHFHSQSSSSTIEPLLLDSPAGDGLTPFHQYPTDSVHVVCGAPFEVDLRRVWCGDTLLETGASWREVMRLSFSGIMVLSWRMSMTTARR